MNDVFIERMIKKHFGAADALILAAVVLGVILVSLISFYVFWFVIAFPMLWLVLTAGAIYGGYKLIGMRLLEYEYSLTNGYVTVDKIMNRQSRKRLTAFECSTCEDIGLFQENEARLKQRSFGAKIYATQFSDHRDAWYMVVHSKKTGHTLLVFNPDEELLEGIKRFIPRPLKFEKFGRQ